jgi:molecular chaperone HscB
VTHFDVFELPTRFELDIDELDRRYRERSLEYHPDRAKSSDRRAAVAKTTDLNEAYRVLKDPVKRAFYLLKLKGVDLDREDAGPQHKMPLEFLEEVMELREKLSEARARKDVVAAQKMADAVAQMEKDALKSGVAALEAADVAKATHQLARVRYFSRFLEEVSLIEEEALG